MSRQSLMLPVLVYVTYRTNLAFKSISFLKSCGSSKEILAAVSFIRDIPKFLLWPAWPSI